MADLSQQQTSSGMPPVSRSEDLDRSLNGEVGNAEVDRGDVLVTGQGAPPGEDENRQLLAAEQRTRLDREWQAIQAGFVDSPRASVEKADALVKETIDAVADSFGGMRDSLEKTWERDREISTEDLRMALQSYRSFFHRLLSI